MIREKSFESLVSYWGDNYVVHIYVYYDFIEHIYCILCKYCIWYVLSQIAM